MAKQPALFFSHGTIYEAFKNQKMKDDFQKIKNEHFKEVPDAIVLFSGHWQTQTIAIATSTVVRQMDEGFPPEFLSDYATQGHPEIANRMIETLNRNGIDAVAEPNRGLDHGALIPLLLLFPEHRIPVIQIAQQYNLDPLYHQKIAETLRPFQEENILFIGSGGLVHNRYEIEKFGGLSIQPDKWAREFDDYVTAQLIDNQTISAMDASVAAYQHPLFAKAHPTSEHFLPLVFASAFGGKPTKVYDAFQWKNLSMAAFKFG
jgi:4,5-DOPA dioxygenase extradiol